MSSFLEKAKAIPRGVEILSDWLGDGGTPVGPSDSQRRANACLKCPANQKGGAFTEAVASAIRKHIEVKNHIGLHVMGEKSLGMCQVCSCQLRLKVHIPTSYIKDTLMDGEIERFQASNSQCWIFQECK
jgi:hypothetical protein